VKRNGLCTTVNAAEVVPGDIVLLGAGQAVPADCKLLSGKPIQVDQAALTGESLPVTMTEGSAALMGSTVRAPRPGSLRVPARSVSVAAPQCGHSVAPCLHQARAMPIFRMHCMTHTVVD
jgi:cation transport ATPase